MTSRALLLALLVGAAAQVAALPNAQAAPPPRAQAAPAAPTPAATAEPTEPLTQALVLEAGAGRLLPLPRPAATVMAADPRVARVQPASPTALFIMALGQGRTTVVATAADGSPVAVYDVLVRPSPNAPPPPGPLMLGGERPRAQPLPSAAAVQSAIQRLVPGAEAVRVNASGGAVVLSGTVANAAIAQRADTLARSFLGEEQRLVNALELLSSVQVNVRVRVAEISRQISRDLGFNWQTLGTSGNWLLGLTSGTAAASNLAGGIAGVAQNRIGVGFNGGRRFDANGLIDALAGDQLITILAEPNLTAQSGETASFLAGGEFPVPVAASSVSSQISIEFKQFGVSLSFVPTVLSPDRLNLRVRPEVSELSQNGAISVPLGNGTVTIPALRVRRAETTIELGSGQSFAIAGLLQRSSTQAIQGLVGLQDTPVLGALFRSERFAREETELVIIVTPYLVRPVAAPQMLAAPTDGFRPATDLERILFHRQIARGGPPPSLRSALDAGFILE